MQSRKNGWVDCAKIAAMNYKGGRAGGRERRAIERNARKIGRRANDRNPILESLTIIEVRRIPNYGIGIIRGVENRYEGGIAIAVERKITAARKLMRLDADRTRSIERPDFRGADKLRQQT